MYVAHLVLTSASCPAPTEADGQRIQDGLWAHACHDLGIEHIRARAGSGHIDVVLFFRSTIHGEISNQYAIVAAIGNLPFLRAWRIVLADGESNEKERSDRPDAYNRAVAPACLPGSLRRPLQPALLAPGQEFAVAGLRRDRPDRSRRPSGSQNMAAQSPHGTVSEYARAA